MARYRNVIGWINNPNPTIVKIRLDTMVEVPLQNGDVIEDTNIAQNQVRTLFSQFTNLTFIQCNLVNVRLNPSHTVIDCLRIEKEYCSHINPDMELPHCGVNCNHVYDQGESVIVDGVEVVPATKIYADKITKRIRSSDGEEFTNHIWCLEDGTQVEII